MLRSLNRFNKQTGISLLEVMLSLSIIAIILVMATRYFFVASGNSNVNKLRGQIGTVVSGLQEYRNQNADYTDLAANGMQTLISDGFVAKTKDVNEAGTTLYNPWNSPIEVVGTTNSATVTTDLPSATECNAVATGYETANGTCIAGANGNSMLKVIVGMVPGTTP